MACADPLAELPQALRHCPVCDGLELGVVWLAVMQQLCPDGNS